MNFREFVDNKIEIYHFSDIDQDEMVVDPKYFGQNYFTKNDTKIPIPRSFFYTNPQDSEVFFKNKPLYKAVIDKDKIYDLSEDKLEYREKNRNNGVLDFFELLKNISKDYIGVSYRIHSGTMTVVSLFVPILAHRVRERV